MRTSKGSKSRQSTVTQGPTLIFSALVALTLPLALLQEPATPAVPQATEALRIFVDCPPFECDLDFLRTEVTFVNFMRDRTDSQVHILVSTQRTGAGGREFTLAFMGQGAMEGRGDTLRYASKPTDTDDDVRRGLARTLKFGLLRFVAGTPVADRITVSYEAPAAAAGSQVRQRLDPWNYWVFRIGGNTFLNGEAQQSRRSVSVNLSANRITEAWKISSSLSGRDSYSRFDLDSVTRFINTSHNYGGNLQVVKSAGPHWSFGGEASVSSSTFNNQDLRARVAPALEFDLFPYSESTRRSLRFNYSIGASYVNYHETTIFSKDTETLFNHEVEVALDLTQPWGSAGISLNGSQYLHDLSKVNFGIFGNLQWRVVRGLSLNIGGQYSIVRDQLSLPAAGATPEEILLQRRQLATNYSYFMSLGLSYTFGSIYNNVVNPRFGGGGRSFFF